MCNDAGPHAALRGRLGVEYSQFISSYGTASVPGQRCHHIGHATKLYLCAFRVEIWHIYLHTLLRFALIIIHMQYKTWIGI